MKIWPIRVLSTLIATGSLQNAAEQLHRTPAALSMTLSNLENELGFTLLDRSGYRLQLTPQGSQFLRHAQELLRQHDRLNSIVTQLREGAEPQLLLSYDYTCNPDLLLSALKRIQRDFPVTEVFVSGHSQLEALKEVAEGLADIALTPWLPTFQQMADFESLRVSQFDLVVAIAKSLVDELGMPRSRDALSELPYLLPRNLNMGINPEQIYRIAGKSRLRVNDSHTLVRYLRAGLGWGIVPRDLVQREIQKGTLLEIDIPGFLDHISAEVHLVKLSSKQLGPAGAQLWNEFAEREGSQQRVKKRAARVQSHVTQSSSR
ncbi:LysR family transcriptional regulator [Aliidiomarina halalkaliphila]|uniref:LysR family transcriptional regulator n=1 Tax=Aliidiomarina halalkaliphila TaxID=2593535 RepID=A0A552X5S5_9GAMM|nr:LysR family transcriptional regulator [Aliidiomarina halalkaliphila]TRW50377.1 LysR family transcriptional regulator [Aliidiomarina halalkaliphila]